MHLKRNFAFFKFKKLFIHKLLIKKKKRQNNSIFFLTEKPLHFSFYKAELNGVIFLFLKRKMIKLKFNTLNIDDSIQNALQKKGFENTSEIQEKVIPEVLLGKDVIGKSKTMLWDNNKAVFRSRISPTALNYWHDSRINSISCYGFAISCRNSNPCNNCSYCLLDFKEHEMISLFVFFCY